MNSCASVGERVTECGLGHPHARLRRTLLADCAAGLLEADNDTAAAALVIAATDPDYTATFLRAVRSEHGYRAWTADEQRAYVRVEAARATMSEGGSGSYLVPFVLDPSVVLTNSSITNPVRSLAKVVTTSSATWNGVKARRRHAAVSLA